MTLYTRLIWHAPCQMKFPAWVKLTETPVCYARKFGSSNFVLLKYISKLLGFNLKTRQFWYFLIYFFLYLSILNFNGTWLWDLCIANVLNNNMTVSAIRFMSSWLTKLTNSLVAPFSVCMKKYLFFIKKKLNVYIICI
jgi:hypothetical protein